MIIAIYCLILASLVVAYPKNAEAYLDLGTGSYFLQIAIATVLGGLFAVKMYWNKIKKYFRSLILRNVK